MTNRVSFYSSEPSLSSLPVSSLLGLSSSSPVHLLFIPYLVFIGGAHIDSVDDFDIWIIQGMFLCSNYRKILSKSLVRVTLSLLLSVRNANNILYGHLLCMRPDI